MVRVVADHGYGVRGIMARCMRDEVRTNVLDVADLLTLTKREALWRL